MQITKHLRDDIFNNGEIFFVLEYAKIILLKLIKLVDSCHGLAQYWLCSIDETQTYAH